MADILYTRDFTHDDWIDNEDVVQAGGEKGFNTKFHDLEAEFDTIATVVGQINTELQKGLRIQPVITLSKSLAANQITDSQEIDRYDNADFPGSKKVYQVSIEPPPPDIGHGYVSYNLIYEPISGQDRTKVSIWFKNEKAQSTSINVKIFSLS